MLFPLLACVAPVTVLTTRPAGADVAFADCVAEQVVDVGMDGVTDFRWTEHYDAMGRKLRVDGDQGGDGGVDAVMRYTVLPDGREAARAWDGDADGRADRITVRAWSPAGETEIYTYGSHGIELIERFSYDEEGRRRTGTVDVRGDGLIEFEKHWVWYDALGPSEEVLRDVQTGMERVAFLWSYDDAGNMLEERKDNDENGSFEAVETRTYDDVGRRESARWDVDGDGHTDNLSFWSYDCP